jgi:hypothetical protein
MSKKNIYLIIAISFFGILLTSLNQLINQRSFKDIFGFYLTDNFYTLHASVFNCIDCDSKYITFKPSKETINKILAQQECTFEPFDYRKHGDYLGSIMQSPPGFWAQCTDGNVCTYKRGGLWFNEQTGLMCYAHIIL